MSNKRICHKFDRMIDDYIDGMLTENEIKKLEAHLAECEECRASLHFALALREMTRASAENVPQEVHDKIIAETGSRGRRRQLIRRGALSVACALLFIASIAAWAMLPGRQKTEDIPPENNPVMQITGAETEASLNDSPIEEPETDAISPMPELQEPTDETWIFEEETVPGELQPDSAAEMTNEEIIAVKTTAEEIAIPSPEKNESAEATKAATDTAFIAESLGAASPGGEDITLALLIVSGLLAVASFIAFLISLSSVRQIPSKKDKE